MRSFEDNAKFHFRWQCSAMLRALGDNGEWLKLSNIGANLKNIFLNVSYTVLGIYLLLNDVKKNLKQTVKISCMCTFKVLSPMVVPTPSIDPRPPPPPRPQSGWTR